MLIEGKHCSLETDDPVKGQAIVRYIDWTYEQNKDEIMKQVMDIYLNGETWNDYDGRRSPLILNDR